MCYHPIIISASRCVYEAGVYALPPLPPICIALCVGGVLLCTNNTSHYLHSRGHGGCGLLTPVLPRDLLLRTTSVWLCLHNEMRT